MKKPLVAPDYDPPDSVLKEAAEGRLPPSPVSEKGEYIHWDKLRHLHPPDGKAAKHQWQRLKFGRVAKMQILPFVGLRKRPFWFCQLPELVEFQHHLDRHAAALGNEDLTVLSEGLRTKFLMSRIIDESIHGGLRGEAIHSSILEGAATSVLTAYQILLRHNPKPKTVGERMVVNNYHAMRFIQEMQSEQPTMSAILELHRILMEGVLPSEQLGQFRRNSDAIVVSDSLDGSILHQPPAAETISEFMQALCSFASGKTPKEFLHPAIRAIVVHFMIGFIHPFTDGNGRTARALFYWVMMKNGYWLVPFISISEVVRHAPGQYKRAFLLTESDDNDLTYFLLHQMDVIRKAFARLDSRIKGEAAHVHDDRWARDLRGTLNSRQIALLNDARQNPGRIFSAYGHQARHNVSYPTARADLLALAEMKILSRYKRGKEYVYEVREGALDKLKREG